MKGYKMTPEREAALVVQALGLSTDEAEAVRTRLEAVGGIAGIWFAGSEVLRDVSPEASSRVDAFLELVSHALRCQPELAVIDSADAVAIYFRARLALRRTESFWVIMLDARGRAIGTERIAEGTLTSCLVHPREVFAPAIRARAAHIVLVHNHPSGDPTPSPEDITLTERLSEAGQILGIPVVDHVVIGRDGHRSIPPSSTISESQFAAERLQ